VRVESCDHPQNYCFYPVPVYIVAPQTNGFIADSDAPLSQQVFDVAVAQVESVVEPNGILDNFGWESVALVHFWEGYAAIPCRLGVSLSAPLINMCWLTLIRTQAPY